MRYLLFILLALLVVGVGIFLFSERSDKPGEAETTKEIIKVQQGPQEAMVEKEIFVTNGIKHSIPLEEFILGIGGGSGKDAVLQGRLPKDVISSIDNPKFESTQSASGWLTDDDPGVSFLKGDTHRFYPFRILVQHEIVNDTLPSGQRVLITYCPLCLTGFALDPMVQGERVEFGVSGLLWESNLVMYDRKTNTLWSQVLVQGVIGPETGTKLEILPSDIVLYGNWKKQYPKGEVLSVNTGFFGKQYTGNLYGGSYFDVPAASRYFSFHQDNRLADKTVVLGIVVNGKAKAYRADSVKEKGVLEDTFEGTQFILRYDFDLDVVRMFKKAEDGTEERINPVSGFWFSWAAAHKDTELYK
jgi:hypothetical protein